jgi:flagellar protein FliS
MYGNSSHAQKYRQADLGSMSPEKMIVALYERIFRDLDQAGAALADNDLATYNTQVCHAQAIITELRGSLDHGVGGEIAANLDALYDFVFQRLLRSLAERDPANLEACRKVLEPLLDAWRQVPAGAGEQETRRRAREGHGAGADPASHGEDTPQTADSGVAAGQEGRFCVTV